MFVILFLHINFATDLCNSANCQFCDYQQCVICLWGYYLQHNCQPCPNNCLTCYNSNCFSCSLSSFYQAGQCINCSVMITSCENCLNTQCLLCQPGFYLQFNQCIGCTQNCVQCDMYECFRCQSGYSLQYGQCICQIDNCQKCSSAGCSICEIGYYQQQSLRCQSCINGCLQCKGYGSCNVCKMGYYSYEQSCSQCPKKCGQGCLNANSCYDLNPTYNSCQGCVYCLSQQDKCVYCQLTHFLVDGECRVCENNCYTCLDSTQCIQCKVGYYKLGQNCEECMANCGFCKESNSCLKCNKGYSGSAECTVDASKICQIDKYMSQNTCKQCSEQCRGCIQYQQHFHKCLSCKYGYYDNQYCWQCLISNCLICTNSQTCQYCMPGFSSFNNSCLIDDPCPEYLHCSYCDIPLSKCFSCNERYTMVNNQCLPCSSNCKVCNVQQCQVCDIGFKGSQCTVCPVNCQVCNQQICFRCTNSTYISNGVCKPCNPECAVCGSYYCTQCVMGFYLLNFQCIPCPQKCANCKQQNDCQSCINTFYLDHSTCERCPNFCYACYFEICYACKTGYYLTQQGCIMCVQPCGSCSDATTCLSCDWKHTYSTTSRICLECSSSCRTCISTSVCLTCFDDNYYVAGSCQQPDKAVTIQGKIEETKGEIKDLQDERRWVGLIGILVLLVLLMGCVIVLQYVIRRYCPPKSKEYKRDDKIKKHIHSRKQQIQSQMELKE